MLVAFVIEQCWHRVPGGTATSAVQLAAALEQRGDTELIGVTARHGTEALEQVPLPMSVTQMPLPRHALYAAWQRARRLPVQTVTGPVDVIHGTGYVVPPATAPTVVTLHDVAFLHDRTGFTRRGLDLMMRAVTIARTESSAVICPSQVVADDCSRAGVDSALIHVVPHGVDPTEATSEERKMVRETHALTRPFVLFVGTPEPRKGLATLVEAMALVDDGVDLVLAGPGGWGVDLDATLAPLAKRVRRVGYVPPAELRALYAEADLFCYPSEREGFGMPVLEAMAQRTPVVTTAGTSMEEFARGAADFVPVGEVGSLADAIGGLLADPGRGRVLGDHGRAVAEAMPWSLAAERTRSVYARVAA